MGRSKTTRCGLDKTIRDHHKTFGGMILALGVSAWVFASVISTSLAPIWSGLSAHQQVLALGLAALTGLTFIVLGIGAMANRSWSLRALSPVLSGLFGAFIHGSPRLRRRQLLDWRD